MGLGISWKLDRKRSKCPRPQEPTPAAGEEAHAGPRVKGRRPRGLLQRGSRRQRREADARGAKAEDSGLKARGWVGAEAEAQGGHRLPA